MKERIALSSLIVVLFTVTGVGQVESFTDFKRFSEDAVFLSFDEFAPGSAGRHLLEMWGIRFGGHNRVITHHVLRDPPPSGVLPWGVVLSNAVPAGAVTELPLVIDSEHPLRRIGLTVVAHDGTGGQLGDSASPVLATGTVTAFDQYGRVLGSTSQEGIGWTNFVGLEATGTEGISRVSIKCDRGVEGIERLMVEYVSPRVFTAYLPQVADGEGSRSSITLLNPSNSTASGAIKFYTNDGDGLELGGLSQTTPFAIPSRNSRTMTTAGQPELRSGYAIVTSNCPLQVQVLFTSTANGTARDVGLVAAPALYRNLAAVFKEVATGIDTAVAFVNPSDEACSARIHLVSEEPRLYRLLSLQIPPRGQVSNFVAELAPDFQGKDLRGSIEVVSSKPLAVIVIRTLNGLATASVPSSSN